MNDDFFSCPHCGGDVPARAKACPHCGSSDADGWRQDTDGFASPYAEDDHSEDDFDYEAFVADEFSDDKRVSSKLKPWQVIVIVLVLFAFLLPLFL
ncbi:zinc ribbon domain-containing protein [Novipirellula artificiosorum]|uniref:Zinc-ribbon domain-containing protein n=1 Tax=Novipirellula artificiosorum TaxID=2528016 RepID=A0A5C6DK77_9BACT|nr:zinc ribbon domain-containing protein [Novipirellula artificiosorum]TWU36001.1 hypothetical protein Poly41_37530 [Novipirellula artificiosorum]